MIRKTKEGESREVAEESEEDEEQAGEVRRPRKVLDPREPTEEERKEHELTHLPFRNWCRHCIRGRGKEEPCRNTKGDGSEMPELHMDFMFMGEEEGGATLTLLVAKERSSRALMATVVPKKSNGTWMAKRLLAWMRELGCEQSDVIVKCDNEPAIVAVVNELGRLRAAKGGRRMVVENSPVHSSKSNGVIERGVQTAQGMIRTLRSALEDRWGVKLDTDHAVWSWMAEYAGWLVTRGEVGKDGRTAYERLKGKRAKVQGLEFGEGVLWKRRPGGGPLGKLTCMWDDGIFLGVKGSTGELIVGDERGIWRTRTVRRKPEGDRWRRDYIKMIAGVPWRLNDEDQNADGEGMRLDVTVMDREYRESVARPEHESIPRAVYIRKEDLEEFGYTVGCPGCQSILKKTTRQAHSEGCRRRLEGELGDTERAQKAKKRKSDFVNRKMEEDAAARAAKEQQADQQGAAPEEQLAGDDMEDESRKRKGDEEVMEKDEHVVL